MATQPVSTYDVDQPTDLASYQTIAGLPFLNVKLYNAKGDTKYRNNGVATATSTTLTSATANFTVADVGKTVLILGAGAAGVDLVTTIATFNSSTSVALAVAASTSVNPASFYWGTDDTANIQAGINALDASAISPYVPSGQYAETITELHFPMGIYLLTGALDFTAQSDVHIRSNAAAILLQTDSTKKIFNFTGCNVVAVQGLQFIGGKYAIDYRNANNDNSSLLVRDCSFQSQRDYCIFTAATVSMTGTGIPYSTGTLTGTSGSFSITGAGTTWSDANHALKDLHVTGGGRDDYYKIAEVTGVGALTLNRPAFANYAGATYEIGDYHLSTKLTIDHCRFWNVARVLHNFCDLATVRDTWVEVFGVANANVTVPLFAANTAVFRQLGDDNGTLHLDGMFGVPTNGTAGVDLISKPRWVDQEAGTVLADGHCRFGGESGGMAIVSYFVPYKDTSPFRQGGRTIIKDSEVWAGQTLAPAGDVGVLIINANGRAATARENVPQFFVYKNNHSHIATPIINNEASLDTATFFGAILVSPERKFRYEIGPNETGTDEVNLDGTWNGAARAGGFQRFTGFLSTTASITVANLGAGAVDTVKTVSLAGAKDGDAISVGILNSLASAGANFWRAWVSGDDTISIQFCNPTTAPTTGGTAVCTFTIRKWKWNHD